MLAILAVLVAWRIGPYFIDALGFLFPKFGGEVSYWMPNVSGRSAGDWFKFFLAIILFWFLFKALGLALGFMVPQAQLFGTTKAVRRFQGLCGEAFIILGLFIGVTLVDAMMRTPPAQPAQSEQPVETPKPSQPPPVSEDEIKRRKEEQLKFERESREKMDEIEAQRLWNLRFTKDAPPGVTEMQWTDIFLAWMEKKPADVTNVEWQSRWTRPPEDQPKRISPGSAYGGFVFGSPTQSETFEHWMARRPSNETEEAWKKKWDLSRPEMKK
jgi:hypothetical protein